MFKILLLIMIVAILYPETMGCGYPIPEPIRPTPPVSRTNSSTHLSNLPDSRRLNTIALLGTHDSATYSVKGRLTQTQVMNITEQLEFGVRVFDMRVRRKNNEFAMYHDFVFLNQMFEDLLKEIKIFLGAHPRELVILLMQEEYKPENSTLNVCRILEKYVQKKNEFVRHWSLSDTIGEYRGKILFGHYQESFSRCMVYLPCATQNFWQMTYVDAYTDKWNMIKNFQDMMLDSNKYNQCYINYLSGHGGFLESPFNIAKFMNPRMTDYFRNPRNTLYIVMADFPTAKLAAKIIDSNQ